MLSLRDLRYEYPNGTIALDGVSLDLPPGMFGLLGPNGAGKSTLMRCIATLQVPQSGQVWFNGIDVLTDPAALRSQLGYLPQDFGVYPRVSAWDLLSHLAVLKGYASRGERRDAVEHLLRQVNLWEVRGKAVAGFSGGMRQRFGIAQALLGNPRLVIVDEPTAGLDPEERQRFLNLLSDIGEHVVVILSTHIVEDVAELCPQMAILAGGRVVAQGAPGALVDNLKGKVWRTLVARGDVDDLRARHQVIATRLQAGRTVLHVLADDPPGDGFVPAAPGLDDVYFATLAGLRRTA